MRTRLLKLLFLACCTLAASVGSFGEQKSALRFDTISTADGLSSSAVSGICQSSAGYLWFGTQAGLNRYDGDSIKIYENEPFNNNSLAHNQIQTIYTDSDGIIWIGTYGGLSRLDPASGDFTTYSHEATKEDSLSNNVVVAICQDAGGTLWVGTLDGLNRLDEETGNFTTYRNIEGDPSSLPNNVVRDLYSDTKGRLWIGTYGGLSLFESQNNNFINYTPGNGQGPEFGSPFVMTITEDPDKPEVLYLGTWNGGLCRFNTETGTSELNTLPDSRIYTSMIDSTGRLWIGTWGGGLLLFSRTTGDIKQYTSNMQESIPHDIVYSLFEDHSGILWIGTNGGGIAKLVDWQNRYHYYRHNDSDPASLPPGRVTSILEDSSGRIWYGIYNQGLHRMDPGAKGFVHYRAEEDESGTISNDIINHVYEDPAGKIWICSNGGIDLYNETSNTYSQPFLEIENYPIEETVIYTCFEDSRGNFWIGSYTEGLFMYHPRTGEFTRFSKVGLPGKTITDNLIREIYEDSRGLLWIGTNNGLNRYDPHTGAIRKYMPEKIEGYSLSHGNVRHISETEDGILLIATMGGGVNMYHPSKESFTHLTTRDGLASNMVRAVLIRENLWYFATQIGVSVYNPANGGFSLIDENSGLLCNELSDGQMVDSKGALHFGSTEGVTVIDRPYQVPVGPPPPVVITGITVQGEPGSVGDPINLPFKHNTISVEFSALDFADPRNNKYSVKLEGLDREWRPPTTRNYVSYSGLPPGKYTLMIRGSGSRNNWNTQGLSLAFSVAPPWWKSIPAILIYTLLAAGSILITHSLLRKKRRQTLKKIALQEAHARELETKVRERTAEIEEARKQAEEATKAKSIFMATMSHEIRTPLNGIKGMLTLLKRTPLNEDQQNYVAHTQTAANSLFTLVNDALDLERIMSGYLTIEKTPLSMHDIADFISGIYGPQAADRGMDFHISVSENFPEPLLGDPSRITQILTNLVSNAIKYTGKGEITCSIETVDEDGGQEVLVRMSVADTGQGIPEDKQSAIFEQFYQLDAGYTKRGTGVGLGLAIVKQLCSLMNGNIKVDSTPGKGTCFTVILPMERAQPISEKDIELKDQLQPREALKSKRILIAEDEAINRLFIQRIIENRGFNVKTVPNGKEAVSAIQSEEYDLVFMDLGMPVLGGLEAAKEIRNYESRNDLPSVPIIALTAYAYQSDIESCMEAGMDDFISKPLNEAILFRKIQEWSGKK